MDENVRSSVYTATTHRVYIQTFGEFEVFADGRKVMFKIPESKEVLATLVDKYGLSLSRPEIFSMVWEDMNYDRSAQAQLNKVIRSLRSTLTGYGCDCLIEMKKGYLRICPERAACDYWKFLQGDSEAIHTFRNEYMSSYAWGEIKNEYIKKKKAKWVRRSFSGERAITAFTQDTARKIEVRTFGGFDVMVDGELVAFSRAKAKELLAYLIERNGEAVSRKEAASVLWETRCYDRAIQKQLDVLIRSLKATLCEFGISEIIMIGKEMQAVPSLFTCDLYRFLEGDPDAMNAYCGEYMSAYTWAAVTEARLNRMDERIRS